jgi:hypothetical protein
MKRYTDEWWQGVKDFNNSFPINIFKRDKEMTANELADWIENGAPFGDYKTAKQASAMLRQQQAEIEALKMRELTDEEIDEVWAETCSDFKLIENGKSKGIINIYDVSRAILKKASEK